MCRFGNYCVMLSKRGWWFEKGAVRNLHRRIHTDSLLPLLMYIFTDFSYDYDFRLSIRPWSVVVNNGAWVSITTAFSSGKHPFCGQHIHI
jgi:hypothetical protein